MSEPAFAPTEDVIAEMMDAYWREQADRLDPDAGTGWAPCRTAPASGSYLRLSHG